MLIALEKVGRLDLLTGCFRLIVVPHEVVRELDFPPDHRHHAAGRRILEFASGQAFDVRSSAAPRLSGLPSSIGPGEADALSVARSEGLLLLSDDRAARTISPHLRIDVSGTLGVVILANHLQLLPADDARDVIVGLVRTGLRISGDAVAAALSRLR